MLTIESKITPVLKGKLKKLNNEFTYKGESFEQSWYGDIGNNNGVYYRSASGIEIKMVYTMHKVGENHYKGLKDIVSIEILDCYM